MNRTVLKLVSTTHVFLYRLTGGAIGGKLAGRPMLLLATTGRRSGRLRTTPLQYLTDGDNMVVVASNAGSPRHPDWWFNLDKKPEGEVQVRKEKMRVRTETAKDEERVRLWRLAVAGYSNYERYQEGIEREIPVVVLRPDG